MYDYLIVGSGLFGSVFAHEATKHGKKCLVIDKRQTTGGNIYCEKIEGITCHMYGPHIFRTNDLGIWNYVNALTPFYNYYHQVSANFRGKIYSLPFNMNTFHQMWGVVTPDQAIRRIKEQSVNYETPRNLEEHCIKLVGTDIYRTLIKGYTEKQWGRPCTELPASIIKNLPFRFTYDNHYFNDQYQGIPIGGYNMLTDALLKNIEVSLDTDYFYDRDYFQTISKNVVYTGAIDQLFDYRFGELEYRSLRFDHKVIDFTENFQGAAGMKYTAAEVPYTRTVEHKHFEPKLRCNHTVVTYEYPADWNRSVEPCYPINDEANTTKYRKYRDLADSIPNLIIGGRLGSYRYMDMHQVVAQSLVTSKKVLNNAL